MSFLGQPIKYNVDRQGKVLGVAWRFTARSKGNVMGRFGGGWQWKVGVMVGGRTVIVSFLVADLRLEFPRKGKK